MALVVKEGILTAGDISVDVNFTPELYDLVWDEHNNQPHMLFMLVFDPSDTLAYPPYVLRRVDGDEKGLKIGGPGILWALGSGAVGPMIEDREYLSGADMLSNGDFHLNDQYWRRPSEGSLWLASGGKATNAGGRRTDDVFEYALELPPARPGNEYQAIAQGVTAAGRVRIRIVFGGRFNPPNMLVNGDMEDGPGVGWSAADNIEIVTQQVRNGSYGMRIAPIPKPQLVTNSDFSAGADDWTLGSTFSIASGGLIAGPNEQPQYITDPGFETLVGWTDVLTPAPMSDDIDLISDGANARDGTGVMRVGPITPHQVLTNADFGSGFDNWFASSNLASPDWTWWTIDPTEGNNGTPCARTIGWSTAGAGSGPLIKYLRADSTNGGGVETYPVKPGESYRLEAYVKGAPGTEGTAYVSIMIPHPTVVGADTWIKTNVLEAPPTDDMRFNIIDREFTIPDNRFEVNCLFEVHDHGLGYWYVDTITLTRTRGNRAQINCDTSITVVPDTRYVLSALLRSGDNMSGGNVRIGVVLTGTGVDPLVVDADKGNTDFEWTRVNIEVRAPTGYDTATPFVAGLDITGDSVWVDAMTFTRVENNSDVTTHDPFDVVADQRYLLSADVTSWGATRGSVTVGVTLTGAGQPDQDVEITPGTLDDFKVKRISTEVRPPEGYTSAVLYVRSTDVEGGEFAIDNLTFTKVDNNSDSTYGDAITVIPERTYRWTQPVFFAAAVERGNVRLGVRCVRAGADDETFYSSPMDKGEAGDTWQTLTFDFTPPSGFDEIIPIVVGTDTEAGYIYLDDGEIRDTDTTTVAFDGLTLNPVDVDFFVNATAPEGSETVRVAVVVPSGTTGVTVGGVSLVRTDQPPATGDEIVADLLTDAGGPLSIGPGDIDCPETLPADWHIANRTNRAALDQYASVLSVPPREYRVTATDPPLLDCKERSALFVDHAPDHPTSPVVLVDAHIKDPDVETMDPPEVDVTDRPTHIKVIGAARPLVSGGTTLIGSTAAVPGASEHGYNNRPMVRTEIVSAGTVDHESYASAYASDLAALAADPPLAVSVTLNEISADTAAALGIDARPDYDVGDWIYVYKPKAGLVDMSRSTMIAGTAVFPRRVRVLDRDRSLPPGYYVVMRRPDGSTFPLPGVLHSPDTTRLTVGDRLPGWVVDPQGKAEGLQYLADRQSQPR